MVNQYRGETTLILVKKKYKLAPSFKALAGIETELNCSILDLIMKISKGHFLKLQEIEAIVRHAVCESANIKFADEIYATGVANVMPQIINFLALALKLEE